VKDSSARQIRGDRRDNSRESRLEQLKKRIAEQIEQYRAEERRRRRRR
jgi:hypothetical protein